MIEVIMFFVAMACPVIAVTCVAAAMVVYAKASQ